VKKPLRKSEPCKKRKYTQLAPLWNRVVRQRKESYGLEDVPKGAHPSRTTDTNVLKRRINRLVLKSEILFSGNAMHLRTKKVAPDRIRKGKRKFGNIKKKLGSLQNMFE